ncbi:DUF4422 domain-containing protein [Veillonella caviae]|uniref:DUF4422 domain-containing protein n=1 Tax=Veillonella caviae TaxID=248316 RepID=UPI0023A88AFC|nr:DUF4422 domain-containing protein [Veillonella caviae]MCI5709088.1 DUF4422 domain-containing protein [Veillonella caviae]MDY5714618.1 DUF4422 domain-containing protein [Veillonella caviae]
MSEMTIMVAVHKPYWMPEENIYMPIHVGAEGKDSIGFVGDNTGNHISLKNPNYCELTALYWFWKNQYADVVGLCHYRRYFSTGKFTSDLDSKKASILKEKDYRNLLLDCECLVPKKRNYYIETVRSQYEHAHYKKDLDILESVLCEFYPGYVNAFNTVMNSKRLHLLNMFVMDWALYDKYCTFLFDVLGKVEERTDLTGYSVQEARIYGFLAERIFNVWLVKNEIKTKEVPVVFLEKINWIKKGTAFLARKFGLVGK